MKHLATRFILPTAIISFAAVTKWWYVLPVDARQTFYWGFPLAFMGEGWQTSGSLQFFVLEGLIDLVVHFFLWTLLAYAFVRSFKVKKIPLLVSGTLWSISFLLIIVGSIVVSISYPSITLRRGYEWTIIDSGYQFIWQGTPRSEQ